LRGRQALNHESESFAGACLPPTSDAVKVKDFLHGLQLAGKREGNEISGCDGVARGKSSAPVRRIICGAQRIV
jgi:hypothetical protein